MAVRIRLVAALVTVLTPAIAAAETPAEMEPLSWLAVPNSHMRSVQADPEQYAELQGNGFTTVVLAWNGALLDTTRLRLVVWGGGHNDYYGNEIYAFDIASLSWSRLNEPTVEWNNCGDPNSDGTANARHTYNGLAYVEHADRMFVSGGALNCTSGSCGASATWAFDFDALAWTDRMPSGSHTTACGNNSAYDPTSGLVYFGDGGGLYAYSYDANDWSQLNADYIYQVTSVVDPSRGLLVMVGNGEVATYDIAGGDFTKEVWATTGGDEFIAQSAVGLDYDPVTDRIVGWADGPVWVLDPETRAWSRYDIEGAPVLPKSYNGTYGRWRYVPSVNAFVLVTNVDDDVHFFKLSDGGELPPPSDDTGTDSSGGGPSTDDTGGGSAESNGDEAGSEGGSTASQGSSTRGEDTEAGAGSTSIGPSSPSNADGGCGCAQGQPGAPLAWGLSWLALLCTGWRRRA